MERLDFNIYMDAQLETTSDATGLIVGLTHLAGQNAFIYANGFPIGTYYIDQAGQITIPIKNATVSVGLDYTPLIIPMPLIAILANGLSVYEPVHVSFLYVDYYLTLGLVVQGQNIPQVSPGEFMTSETPTPTSDYYKVPMYGGWDPRKEFMITQSYPAPMTVLAISYTLQVAP